MIRLGLVLGACRGLRLLGRYGGSNLRALLCSRFDGGRWLEGKTSRREGKRRGNLSKRGRSMRRENSRRERGGSAEGSCRRARGSSRNRRARTRICGRSRLRGSEKGTCCWNLELARVEGPRSPGVSSRGERSHHAWVEVEDQTLIMVVHNLIVTIHTRKRTMCGPKGTPCRMATVATC